MITNKNLKHLGPGSECPPLHNKQQMRLYSMIFCPYVQRVRIVLEAKKIPYEMINVKLRSQVPEWYTKINPTNQVPTLQLTDGRLIFESLVVSEYLEEAYPEVKLKLSDPYENAQNKLAMENFTKVVGQFYKTIMGDKEAAHLMGQFLNEFFLCYMKNDFLGGKQASFADYMIWPWIERIEFLRMFRDFRITDARVDEMLTNYIKRMLQVRAVRATYMPPEGHNRIFNSMITSETRQPDYDIGLEYL